MRRFSHDWRERAAFSYDCDVHAQPTSYHSPKLEGRRIDGKGGRTLVVREAVEADELVVVFGGEVVQASQLTALSPAERLLTLQVEEELYLVSVADGPADWVNHSCDPNCGLRGQIALVAMRGLEPGEEICFDYAMSDGTPYDQFPCGCGAKSCRGAVTGEDWSRPELWERYSGYFSPYLQRRIDAALAGTGELRSHKDRGRARQGRRS
ncbi:MAG TPA: SET domain-containing protein-lysine N-methyltransferase [Myxococcota bacterium]|nr:SET domain-containing protein-lysine N-methyltransferase [Myxococcota bacterium]